MSNGPSHSHDALGHQTKPLRPEHVDGGGRMETFFLHA